jgi:hypothetical protein
VAKKKVIVASNAVVTRWAFSRRSRARRGKSAASAIYWQTTRPLAPANRVITNRAANTCRGNHPPGSG